MVVEKRSPGRPVVGRLPNGPGSHAHVVLELVFRIHRNGHHASGSHSRANEAKLQAGERVGVDPRLLLVVSVVLRLFLLLVFGFVLLARSGCGDSLLLVGVFVLRFLLLTSLCQRNETAEREKRNQCGKRSHERPLLQSETKTDMYTGFWTGKELGWKQLCPGLLTRLSTVAPPFFRVLCERGVGDFTFCVKHKCTGSIR